LDDEETDWDIDAETGVITARLPAGTTTVELRWVGLPEERTGRWLSIGGCLIWIALAVVIVRDRRNSTQRRKDAKHSPTRLKRRDAGNTGRARENDP
jgi:hypothetical protein